MQYVKNNTKIIFWLDIINNTVKSPKSDNRTPLNSGQLKVEIERLQRKVDIVGIVHCVREGTPDVYNKLKENEITVLHIVKNLSYGRKQKYKKGLKKYSKLHLNPFLELKTLFSIILNNGDLKRICKKKNSKPQTQRMKNSLNKLCNNCVEQNERDNFIRCRTLAKVAEKIDSLDVGEKLKNMERRLKDLVDEKIGNARKISCDKVKKTYAAVVAVETTSEKLKGVKTDENSKSHNINKSIRLQGIPVDPNKTKGEILSQQTMKLAICSIRYVRIHMSRKYKDLENFEMIEKNSRAVLVTLANEHEARITLAKSREFRNNFVERNIYMLQALTKDDALKENQMLKKRRELLDGGIPKEKLKIRNLELYNDGFKVQMDVQNAHWLGGFLNILQLNTRSLVNIERRSKFINALINSDYNVPCLSETWLNNYIHDSEFFLEN